MRPLNAPCEDALKAMPGDTIHYGISSGAETDTGIDVVRAAGWQPGPKGGKIWTYETLSGVQVANNAVSRVIKAQPKTEEASEKIDGGTGLDGIEEREREFFDEEYFQQRLMTAAEDLKLAPTYMVILACIMINDAENITVAADLLRIRARQLRTLEKISAPTPYGQFGGEEKIDLDLDHDSSTNIPLKEEKT